MYAALVEALVADIGTGKLRSGDRMPTHRELARLIGASLGTVTRAYAEAERRGLIRSQVGNGTFVQDTGAGPHVQGGLLQYAPDLNGDGKAEHIYGGGGSLTVSYFNGTGTGGTYYQPAVFDFVAVDLNNDGLKDIATVSTLEPIVSVLLQGANGTFGPRLDYVVGQSPRSLTAGDWDNDGKMDLAVQDNASGRVTILRNTCLP